MYGENTTEYLATVRRIDIATAVLCALVLVGAVWVLLSGHPKVSPRAVCEDISSRTVLYMVENKALADMPRIDDVLKAVCK